MKRASTSTAKTFILLLHLLLPFLHAGCTNKCDDGYTLNGSKCAPICPSGRYIHKRHDKQKCERCTRECSVERNEVEVAPCSLKTNRICHCKPGFYCEKENIYNKKFCHAPCLPCEPGTFSSTHSLNPSCTPHTDCARLMVLKEGTATQDRECEYPTTVHTTMTTTTPTHPSSVITTLSSTTTSISSTTDSELITTTPGTHTNFPNKQVSSALERHNTSPEQATKHHLSSRSTMETHFSLNDSLGVLPIQEVNPSNWLLLFVILLIFLLVLAALHILRKNPAQKTLLKYSGFISGKHEEPDWKQSAAGHPTSQSQTVPELSRNVEAELPLGSDVREANNQVMGVPPHSAGFREVSMEHNGKGENVSNTVGSIFIYSPGVVVLGSNSGDKKEEAGVCEESVPLISTPQQESSPPSQEVKIGISAQAEEERSLSFPVPATGK